MMDEADGGGLTGRVAMEPAATAAIRQEKTLPDAFQYYSAGNVVTF
jgi:hypothetical protein